MIEPSACHKSRWLRQFRWIFLVTAIMGISLSALSQESILDKKITVNLKNITTYEALNQIGNISGCFFIYDSKDVKNDRKIKSKEYNDEPLIDILKKVLSDTTLRFKVIEKHVLIFKDKPGSVAPKETIKDSVDYIIIEGRILDKDTKNPIPLATISVDKTGLGNISNFDGIFSIRVPNQYRSYSIIVSHLGYQNLSVPIPMLEGTSYNLYIQPCFIPIQEVFIRNIDAKSIVKTAIENKTKNYLSSDVYLTSFYREGVKRNNKYLSYSEAVFKIFKSAYDKGTEYDQVRLLKSRKLELTDRRDTLIFKLKAGIKGALDLDIIKSMPDFLDPEFMDNYTYTKSDIIAQDSMSAYAIKFEQKPDVTQPLFSGTIYVDVKNLIIIGAEFGINPKYVEQSAHLFVTKRNKNINITPEEIQYSVRYLHHNGQYYIYHVRGDLTFKVKERHQIFSSNYSLFLEFVSGQIDTLNVQRFTRRDVIKPNIVFSEENYTYDSEFWKELNIISPEEDISKAIKKINPKVESLENEWI